jgi:hypothetical protein
MDTLGVSASFLARFVATIDPSKTTQHICDEVIKPATQDARVSYLSTLEGGEEKMRNGGRVCI